MQRVNSVSVTQKKNPAVASAGLKSFKPLACYKRLDFATAFADVAQARRLIIRMQSGDSARRRAEAAAESGGEIEASLLCDLLDDHAALWRILRAFHSDALRADFAAIFGVALQALEFEVEATGEALADAIGLSPHAQEFITPEVVAAHLESLS